MIVTLTGENRFALDQELDKLVQGFVKKYGDLALERLDGEETELDKINAAIVSLPFLANKKLVLLRVPSKSKQFMEQAEQLLQDVPETNEIILIEPKLDKRTAYYKYLRKQTDFREFPELDQLGLANWLVKEAKARNGSIGLSDARYLVERVGTDQQLLSKELEKLLLYDSKIDRGTINLLTEPTPQSTIFQLLESAFEGNTKATLRQYAEQRAQKVEPAQIIAMLAWQLHVLALVKVADGQSSDMVAKEAKLNPFVVRKSQGIAQGLTLKQLKKLIDDLLKIDIATKRIGIDADEALQHYLISIAE